MSITINIYYKGNKAEDAAAFAEMPDHIHHMLTRKT